MDKMGSNSALQTRQPVSGRQWSRLELGGEIQLTLEHHGFELLRPTYMQICINGPVLFQGQLLCWEPTYAEGRLQI